MHVCVCSAVQNIHTQAFHIRQCWQQEVGCGFGAVSQEVADCITAAQMEVGGGRGRGGEGEGGRVPVRDGLWGREGERGWGN